MRVLHVIFVGHVVSWVFAIGSYENSGLSQTLGGVVCEQDHPALLCHDTVTDAFMRAWALVNIARSISYQQAGVFNGELLDLLIDLYGLLRAVHLQGARDAGCRETVPVLARALGGGIRALCDVQPPETTWAIERLLEHIMQVSGDYAASKIP